MSFDHSNAHRQIFASTKLTLAVALCVCVCVFAFIWWKLFQQEASSHHDSHHETCTLMEPKIVLFSTTIYQYVRSQNIVYWQVLPLTINKLHKHTCSMWMLNVYLCITLWLVKWKRWVTVADTGFPSLITMESVRQPTSWTQITQISRISTDVIVVSFTAIATSAMWI